MDILIKATATAVRHKLKGICPPRNECYWRVGQLPLNAGPGDKILFGDEERVHAKAEIKKLSYEEKLGNIIIFFPLNKVDEPLPKKAPMRGYTYIKPK